MNPQERQDQPILHQGGIKITSMHLIAGERSYKWKNLGIVRLMRTGDLLTKLTNPTFQLMIAKKNDLMPFSVFETKDAELAKRIEAAINTVAQMAGARREK